MARNFVATLLRRKNTLFTESLAQWRRDFGDDTLKLDFDLDQSSIVLDVGGYKGQWSSDIYARYRCKIYVFEPIAEFYEFAKRRFARNPNIVVLKKGLASNNRRARISKDADASSVFKESDRGESIALVSLSEFLDQYAVDHIDLLGINIEGGEYELLDYLVSEGRISVVDNILVQFHDFVPGAKARMEQIQQRLSTTHSPVFQYPFVWEHWQIRAKSANNSGQAAQTFADSRSGLVR
jgi:FkbM family methyltransferase